MARLPNFLVIIRSEKLSGKGQGRGGRGAKKRTFRFGKKNVSFPKVETFRFADYTKLRIFFDKSKFFIFFIRKSFFIRKKNVSLPQVLKLNFYY